MARNEQCCFTKSGTETQEIFETLTNTGEDYDTAKTKLDEYFSPKKNVTYEIFQFRQARQQAGESVEEFATRLRKLTANCGFHYIHCATFVFQNACDGLLFEKVR